MTDSFRDIPFQSKKKVDIEKISSDMTKTAQKTKGTLNLEEYQDFIPNKNVQNNPDLWDWSDALNKAIADAYSFGDSKMPQLVLPNRVIGITKPILHDQNGNYVRIIGKGIRQTRIKALVAMDSMLVMGKTGNAFDGRNLIEHVTFDGNHLATCGIDATQLAYSTVQNCEFIKFAPNGWGIKIGKWVNRIFNCLFNGLGSDSTTPVSNGVFVPNDSTNNLTIEDNSFTSCLVGVQSNATPHDVNIFKNTFDNCINTAIWFKQAGRKIGIKDNYFELCGMNGVTVATSASTSEIMKGAIVGTGSYIVEWDSEYTFKDLLIKDNQFANVAQTAPITLSHVSSLEVKGNQCLEQYPYENLVDFRWRGVYRNFAKRVSIDHAGGESQFTKGLVGINTKSDYGNQQQSGIVVKDYTVSVRNNWQESTNIFGSPINWNRDMIASSTFNVVKDGISDLLPVWKLDGNDSVTKQISLDSSTYSHLKGQYFRLHWLAKGDATNVNGLWVKVRIDEGSGFVVKYDEQVTSSTWTGNSNALIYIPKTAVSVKITLELVNKTVPAWIKYFDFSSASLELGERRFSKEILKRSAAPTSGTWSVGDIVENSAPAASGYMGWVCTVAGTPGTWKGYGLIQA